MEFQNDCCGGESGIHKLFKNKNMSWSFTDNGNDGIPFKCPFNDFSCKYVNTLTCDLDMDCNKCEYNNKKNMVTGTTSDPKIIT